MLMLFVTGFPQFRLVVSQLIARVSDILITIWLSWWLVLFPCYRLSTSLFGILLLAEKRIKTFIRDIELRFFLLIALGVIIVTLFPGLGI